LHPLASPLLIFSILYFFTLAQTSQWLQGYHHAETEGLGNLLSCYLAKADIASMLVHKADPPTDNMLGLAYPGFHIFFILSKQLK
jgi:hypothetical protein